MYRDKRVAVVMPVHNEEDHVERAIKRVPHFVDLIVVVDDGSTDDTWRVLSRITDRRLTKLRHSRNAGVGAATKTGYRCCLDARADLIAVMDGDGQMDGRDLFRLLERALNGVDYVKGNRFLDAESIACMPRLRYIGNRFFSWLARRAASFDHDLDAHCGYTVIQHQALNRLVLDDLYDRYGFPTEMFFAAHRAGLAVESVPVRTVYADEVSGINPFTAVPAILFLIARSYVRRRFSAAPWERRHPSLSAFATHIFRLRRELSVRPACRDTCAPRAPDMAFKPGQADPIHYHLEA
jgi:glycosyltransferase involved in cell wall biosynthesis